MEGMVCCCWQCEVQVKVTVIKEIWTHLPLQVRGNVSDLKFPGPEERRTTTRCQFKGHKTSSNFSRHIETRRRPLGTQSQFWVCVWVCPESFQWIVFSPQMLNMSRLCAMLSPWPHCFSNTFDKGYCFWLSSNNVMETLYPQLLNMFRQIHIATRR